MSKIGVLLSIKPIFAWKILSGEKKFEYRKTIPSLFEGMDVFLYATDPVRKIVGEFKIKRVIKGTPEEVWEKTCEESGVSRSFFFSYFRGRKVSYAIEICSVKRYSHPLKLSSVRAGLIPPRSFAYIDLLDIQKIRKQSG